MSSEKSGHFRWREVAKQKALQGAKINWGMLREGKETNIAGTESRGESDRLEKSAR